MDLSQTILPIFILVIVVALLVAIFFASKHNYEKKQQIKIFYGKLRFFYTGKVRYRRFKLKGVDLKVWQQKASSTEKKPEVYLDLKKRYSFSHDELKYLNDQQIEALSRCLVDYPNISYNAVYKGKDINKLKTLQTELKRFKELVNQRKLHHQVQQNFFNLDRKNQIVILKRRYHLNKTNLRTLSEDEARELENCVNTYLNLVNIISYNSDSVIVLGSLTQQLQLTQELMIRRVKAQDQARRLNVNPNAQ